MAGEKQWSGGNKSMNVEARWLPMLQDPDPKERVLALEGLTDESPEHAYDHVVRGLSDDAPLVRAASATLISKVSPAISAHSVFPLLKDSEEEVRLRVIESLGVSPSPEIEEKLLSRLDQETSEKVLASLIICLGRQAGPQTLSRLAPFLKHSDDRVRANTEEAMDGLLQRAYQSWMLPLKEDSNNRVRANAVVALGRFHPAAAVEVMEDLVAHHDKWHRMSAAWAAGASGVPSVVQTVIPLLRDPDSEVRIQTLRSLAQHRQLPSRKALSEWLENEEDPSVLHYAQMLLAGNSNPTR